MADKTKKREENKQFIESLLNNMLKEDIIDRLAWVVRAVPLSDLRDVALGYVIGVTFERLERHGLISEILDGSKLVSEDYRNLMAALDEKLPKIVEKVENEFREQ